MPASAALTSHTKTARMLRSGLFEAPRGPQRRDAAADPDFQFGLERILDGAAAAIQRAATRH
jgi:hypothetical protein